jgi:glycine/D-amino acid oxidase-like deaminating enzyme
LTTFLLNDATRKGATFLQAEALSLKHEDDKVYVHAMNLDGTTFSVPCDNLVIAAGPWTWPVSDKLLGKTIHILPYAGTSLIVNLKKPVTADCLFMNLTTQKSSYHPEIFPRGSGKVFIGGVNFDLPLPASPDQAIPRQRDLDDLRDIADAVLDEYTIEAEQVCFRPMTSHGDPYISPVHGVSGVRVFVGAGHAFWGITLGPGTGRVLSEMVLQKTLSANVGQLKLPS